MTPQLTITRLTGFGRGKTSSFSQSNLRLGTEANCDLRFDSTWDKTVDGHHANLVFQGGDWWLEDLSRQGCWVDGRKVERQRLTPGMVVELGQGGPRIKLDFVEQRGTGERPDTLQGSMPVLESSAKLARASQPAAVVEPARPEPLPAQPRIARKGSLPVMAMTAALAVVALVILGAFWLVNHKNTVVAPAAKSGTPAGQTAPARGEWEPVVGMGGQLFPSYLVASATANPALLPKVLGENCLGDPVGLVGVKITSPGNKIKASVSFEANTVMQTSTIDVVLPNKGETYVVCPKINYRYDALLRVKQALPLTLMASVAVDDGPRQQKPLTLRVNSINDCPFGIVQGKKGITMDWMFAAYVNENHPWSDGVRKEALQTGLIDAFIGYQGSIKEVQAQVFALWHVFQKRGFKYSSITTTSSETDEVMVQQMRLLEECIKGSQANCADGSVLFASVLRQIGIEPVLVLVPGHMFVGFYSTPDKNPARIVCLETTMMGNVDIATSKGAQSLFQAPGAQDIQRLTSTYMQELKSVVSKNATIDAPVFASWVSFKDALLEGDSKAKYWQDKLRHPEARVNWINIQEARKIGVTPLAYER